MSCILFTLDGKSYRYEDFTGVTLSNALAVAKEMGPLVGDDEKARWCQSSIDPCVPVPNATNMPNLFSDGVLPGLLQELLNLKVLSEVFSRWMRENHCSPSGVADERQFADYLTRYARIACDMEDAAYAVSIEKRNVPNVYNGGSTLFKEAFSLDEWEKLMQAKNSVWVSQGFKRCAFPSFDDSHKEPAVWFRLSEECVIYRALLFQYAEAHKDRYISRLKAEFSEYVYYLFSGVATNQLNGLERLLNRLVDDRGEIRGDGFRFQTLGPNARLNVDSTLGKDIEESFGIIISNVGLRRFAPVRRNSWRSRTDNGVQYVYLVQVGPMDSFGLSPGSEYDLKKNGFLQELVIDDMLNRYSGQICSNLSVVAPLEIPNAKTLSRYLRVAPRKAISHAQLGTFLLAPWF